MTRATRPSWSTATRRPCRPTTTPPTGSTSNRSRPRTCSRLVDTERSNGDAASASSCSSAARPRSSSRKRAGGGQGIPILGTSPDAIDLAEDRDRFQARAPRAAAAAARTTAPPTSQSSRQSAGWRADLAIPLVVRPSYVLGGRAMQIVREEGELGDSLLGTLPELVPADVKARYPNDKTGQIEHRARQESATVRSLSVATPSRSTSIALCRQGPGYVFVAGIMEHIEEAGIHSGDSACALPPPSLAAVERSWRSSSARPANWRKATSTSSA
jgi:carbamoyl-phosphate synthase large subunit